MTGRQGEATARESTAREFGEALWALAALDATQTARKVRDGAIPHLSPGKQPEAPTGPRDGAAQH